MDQMYKDTTTKFPHAFFLPSLSQLNFPKPPTPYDYAVFYPFIYLLPVGNG